MSQHCPADDKDAPYLILNFVDDLVQVNPHGQTGALSFLVCRITLRARLVAEPQTFPWSGNWVESRGGAMG